MHICLTLYRGVIKTTLTFLVAAVLSITSALALLIAAAMWTSIVSLVQATNRTRTGIVADFGQGIWLTWAAFAFSLTSVLPYVIRWEIFRFTRALWRSHTYPLVPGHFVVIRIVLYLNNRTCNRRAGCHVSTASSTSPLF
jgi:hypothetical protein